MTNLEARVQVRGREGMVSTETGSAENKPKINRMHALPNTKRNGSTPSVVDNSASVKKACNGEACRRGMLK